MTPKQKKIAAKAEPRNKIDGKDFAVLRAEKAKNRGKGLQDEKMKPGKIMKANKGDMAGKHFFDGFSKVFKGAQDKGRVATIVGVKPGSAIGKGRKQRKRFKSLEEMRKAKGFKPGETVSQFNKRQQLAKRAVEAARATRIGKIVLPIAAAGVGAVQLLKSKMKKKEEKPKKKMGGGMMMRRPMMANKGKMADKKADKKTSKFIQRRLTLGGGGGRLPIPLLIGIGVSKAAKEFFKKRNPGKFPYVKPNQKFLKSLKTKAPISKKMGGGLTEATQRLKAQGKMGGGMMKRKPMMAKKGEMIGGISKTLIGRNDKKRMTAKDMEKLRRNLNAANLTKTEGSFMGGGMMKRKPMMANKGKIATVEGKKKIASLRDKAKKLGNRGKGILKEIMYGRKDPKGSSKYMGSFMGGGMMQRPMMAMGGGMMPGYKKGKSVMAKGCKLGRKKPTKMYT